MNSKQEIDEFLAQPVLAVAGVSRSDKKFGTMVFQDLKKKGYTVYAINPNASELYGQSCYPDPAALPQTPGGVVLVVPPAETEKLVREIHAAGIRRVWMQPGAESAAAVEYCRQNGITAVVDQCILMHSAPNQFPHSWHRWFNKLAGKLPK